VSWRLPRHYTPSISVRRKPPFRADAGGLTIEPGPKATTLNRVEPEQLGLTIRDDYNVPVTGEQEPQGVIESILAALKEALTRCRGPEEIWMARDLKRAMALVGGLDEKTAQEILDQEGGPGWPPG